VCRRAGGSSERSIDRQRSEATRGKNGGTKPPPSEHVAEVVHAHCHERCSDHNSRYTPERDKADPVRSPWGQASQRHRYRDDADRRRSMARRKRKAGRVNQPPGRPRSLCRRLRRIIDEIHNEIAHDDDSRVEPASASNKQHDYADRDQCDHG
jgi:hypothetical protein